MHAHVVAVAGKSGHVVRVHAPAGRFERFRVGLRISFAARRLGNGMLAGSGFSVTGHATRVRVHGVVRAYDAQRRRITLAAGGALVRMRLAPIRRLQGSAPTTKVGDEVTVTASVDEDDESLEALEVDDEEGDG